MNAREAFETVISEHGEELAREAVTLIKRIIARRRRTQLAGAHADADVLAAERRREIIRDAGNGE